MNKVVCVSNPTLGGSAAIVDNCSQPAKATNCFSASCNCGGTSPLPTSKLFCFCETTPPCSNEPCPTNPNRVAFYGQTIVDGECVIPEVKPDAEKLLKIHNKVVVLKSVSVDSKEIDSEGNFVDGKKVFVTGFLSLGFEYSACTPDQKVHFFHCDVPFEGLVMEADGSLLPPCFNLNEYIVHVSVEQVQVQQLSPRCFSKVAILLIWLEPRR